MINKVKLLGIASVYAIAAMSFSACGDSSNSHDDSDQHEHVSGDSHEHGDEEMDHSSGEEVSAAMEIMACPKWEDGEHEHSTYICPMWEEEGELESPGDCPKCGMTLVVFDDVREQHDAQNHEDDGHDHEH